MTRALEVLKCKVETLETVSVEHSQKYDSQASGGTEVGVRAVRGLFRTMRLCIEKRTGRGLPVRHPLSSWLLEHVSLLLNACVRGEDGLTSWARARGRAFGQRLVGFGEKVLWKMPTKGPQHNKEGNMSARWGVGIFIGYNRSSNSYRFSTAEGDVHESRALQRKPILERWDPEKPADIKVTPWSMRITEAAVKVAMGAEVDGQPPPVPDAAPEARRVKITMKVLQEFGYTESCKQCDHIRAFNEHKAGIAHSEVCRKRIMTAIAAATRGAARFENE